MELALARTKSALDVLFRWSCALAALVVNYCVEMIGFEYRTNLMSTIAESSNQLTTNE